jgi:hypothetical protein
MKIKLKQRQDSIADWWSPERGMVRNVPPRWGSGMFWGDRYYNYAAPTALGEARTDTDEHGRGM